MMQINVVNLLNKMTIEEKIGQMCVPILQKNEITPEIVQCISEFGVGMIRFCPNAEFDNASEVVGEPNPYQTAGQTAEFTNSLQKLAVQSRCGIPLIVAVDQEGGTRNDVNRNGAMAYGSHMCFGVADDTELTYRVAKATAEEFRAMGIHMIQAPIVDVFRYQGRCTMKAASFGEDPVMVAKHALAMQKGFQDGGVIAMIKHFPGYGSLETDAHKGTAVVHKKLEELEQEDFYPFYKLIAENADGIMTGHVIVSAVDDKFPATLSKRLIQTILRGKMGFEGIVETDAMRMRAIQDHYGTGKACVLAVEAGNDLVLLRGNRKHFLEGYDALIKAVHSGALPEAVIDQAVLRILRLKEKKGLFNQPFTQPEKAQKIVGSKEHRSLLRELAQRSVSVLKKKSIPLQLDEEKKLVVINPIPQKLEAALDEEQCPEMLAKAIKRHHKKTDYLLTQLEPMDEEIVQAKTLAEKAAVIIVGTCNAIIYDRQVALVKALQELGKPLIVVAMESPCDIDVLDNIQNYICMCGCAKDWADAVADCVFGTLNGAHPLPIRLKNVGL